jgi:hypothetical protein
MSIFKLAMPFLCAAAALTAQVPVDLNGLAVAAGRYASHGVQGQPHQPALDLRLLKGDNGADPSILMGKATDVQRWTVFYDASPTAKDELVPPIGSASVKCIRGLFSDFFTSPSAIPNCKSLEATWFALNLDAAIAQLNANGYIRGFSEVSVRRPDGLGIPDEPVYVFTCPWERTIVAISTNTGAVIWYQQF